MDVLIAADMEGIAGIDDYGDCLPSHPSAYARGRRLMTDEVLTVVAALREAGAERISVGDWHMVGTNVERERMPDGVEVRPIADLALAEAEPSMSKAHGGPLDAVVLVGHHASTPNPRAFCSHTFIWDMEVLLDGEGRARARSREVDSVRAELSEVIGAALAAPLQPPPARSYPAELRIVAEGKEIAKTTVSEPAELLNAIATAFRTSQVSREYRQLAKLLPAGHDSWARSAQRRLGSLLATPVMRSKERRWLASASGSA